MLLVLTLVGLKDGVGEIAASTRPPVIVYRLRNLPQDAVLTQEDRQELEALKALGQEKAFFSLGRVVTEVPMTEAREAALQLILELEDWQNAAESELLSSKLGWDEANAGLRYGPNSTNRWNERTFLVFEVLSEISRRGRSDAILIVAPFFFDRSQVLPGDPPQRPLSSSARSVLIAGRKDAITWNELRLGEYTFERERLRLSRWWIAHARDFGAKPPSSENATFEEVLELNRTARAQPGNHRFEPVPPPPLRPDEPRIIGAWNWDPSSRSWQKSAIPTSMPTPRGNDFTAAAVGGIAVLVLAWGFIVWRRRLRERIA